MAKKFPGVREKVYKNKAGRIVDVYYSIRYTRNGKQYEEGIGKKSEGVTPEKAYEVFKSLKMDIKTGQAFSLKDKCQQEAQKRHFEEKMTFGDFFETHYVPHIRLKNKISTIDREIILFDKWLNPAFGHIPLSRISPNSLMRLLNDLGKAGLSNRTQHYAIALTRQVFNHAIKKHLFDGNNPASRFEFKKEDNKRVRFLTKEELYKLLEALKKKSYPMYLMALLSAHCGLRAGEIFKLTWADVHLEQGVFLLKDTKNGKNRYAYMTERVFEEFFQLKPETGSQLVFKDRNGQKIKHVSRTFERTVKELNLNKGVSDRRQKVVFHSLRHTYASRLVQQGASLYETKELLGHSDIKMTMRYAHLSEAALRNAVLKLDF